MAGDGFDRVKWYKTGQSLHSIAPSCVRFSRQITGNEILKNKGSNNTSFNLRNFRKYAPPQKIIIIIIIVINNSNNK